MTTVPRTMHAWRVVEPGPVTGRPLQPAELPVPAPGAGRAAGPGAGLRGVPYRPARRRGRPAAAPAAAWCPATRWSARSSASVGGVGRFARRATGSASPGCAAPAGRCAYCRRGRGEPVPELALHRLGRRRRLRRVRRRARPTSPTGCPTGTRDAELAPLLCAGIIGYRALRRSEPAARRPAGHLRLRRARPPDRPGRASPRAPRVHVLTRSPSARELALRARRRLGRRRRTTSRPSRSTRRSCSRRSATWCRSALRALDRGGTLAIAGIHLTDVPALNYQATCSRSASCAASPPTPAPDGRELPGAGRPAPPAGDHHALSAGRRRPGAGRPGRRPGQRRRRAPSRILIGMDSTRRVLQMRLVVETADYDDAVAFYRDVLGAHEELVVHGDAGEKVTILDVGTGHPRAVQPGPGRHDRPGRGGSTGGAAAPGGLRGRRRRIGHRTVGDRRRRADRGAHPDPVGLR